MRMGRRVDTRRIGYAFLSVLLLLFGFAAGFTSCLHARIFVPSEVSNLSAQYQGDASTGVRAEVLSALHEFQNGYVQRDPENLGAFASKLIAKDNDVVLLGTDAGEWVVGHSAVSEFIKADWRAWGDFRFDVDHSAISSSGNVAWATSVGLVHFKSLDRPVRFSAVMIKDGDRWTFRKIQFQWADKGPSSADLLQPRTYFTLPKLVFQRAMKGAR